MRAEMPTNHSTCQSISGHGDFSAILAEPRESYGQPNQAPLPRYVNSAFDRLMLQSGLETSPQAWLMLSVFCGVTVGGIALLLANSLLLMGLGVVLGLLLPVLIATQIRERRQRRILAELPDATQRLANLLDAGRSLADSVAECAENTRGPLRTELIRIAREFEVGAPPQRVLSEFSDRVGLPAVAMLATVLGSQVAAGPHLAETVRGVAGQAAIHRLKAAKLAAFSAESQWPAGAIVLLPILTAVIFLGTESTAAMTVMNSFFGRVLLGAAAVLWCLGAIVVLRAIRVSR